jgi:hypothetical protein
MREFMNGVWAFVYGVASLIFGAAMFWQLPPMFAHSALSCRREADGVSCEIRRAFPGPIAFTDRFRLESAEVEPRRAVSYRGTSHFNVLVLNRDVTVPSSRALGSDADSIAARLNGLLDGKLAAVPAIPLTAPTYFSGTLLGVLATLLTALGAFLLWGVLSSGRRPPGQKRTARRLWG